MNVDVWIGDDDHLVHKMQIHYGMKLQGQTVDAVMTMELYAFGVKVDVVAPPANEVKDFSDLAGLMTNAATSGA